MTPEQMQKKIEELEFKLNQIVKPDRYLFDRNVELLLGKNFKIGSGGKFGIFGADPVVQQTPTGVTNHMTTVGGTAVTESNGFNGNIGSTYHTIGDIVATLKLLGLLKT